TERQQFRDFRDLNKDGHLDGSEDGRLSKAEILGNWNMFVGSQATNYGEDLTRHHDEL
ncbi:RCN3 isoform 5, partial [Pan troglodytes]